MGDIFVYASDCEDFDTIGLCGALTPTACVFSEEANGISEISMEHPIDGLQKYRDLVVGNIIKCDVPVRTQPTDSQTYQSTNMYRYYYGKINTSVQNRKLYKSKTGTSALMKTIPATNQTGASTFEEVRLYILASNGTGSDMRYHVTFKKYEYVNKKKTYVAKSYDGWVLAESVITNDAWYEEYEDRYNGIESAVGSWNIKSQLFRISGIDLKPTGVSVTAQHIFYDLLGNIVTSRTANSCQEQCQVIQNTGVVMAHDFTIRTDISATKAYEPVYRQSPVAALLDAGNGVCALFGGEILRDNYSVYVAQNAGYDRGVVIEYGKNLTGVTQTVDSAETVTGIMPVGQTKKGEDLLLESVQYTTEKYSVTSRGKCVFAADVKDLNNQYVFPDAEELPCEKIAVLDCSGYVKAAGTSAAQLLVARKKLVDAAVEQFSAEKNYKRAVTIEVSFVMLGDTEEYAAYRELESVHLYDTVTIRDSRIGITAQAKVNRVDFNVLTEHMNAIKLGTATANLGTEKVSKAQLPVVVTNSILTAKGTADYATETAETASDEAQAAQTAAHEAVKRSEVEYCQTDSPTSSAGGVWINTCPVWEEGKYVWMRTKITNGNDVVTYTPSASGTCISGRNGVDGEDGEDGTVILELYKLGTSGSTAPTGTWSSQPSSPTSSYPFLWNKEVINGVESSPFVIAMHTEDGRSVDSITDYYQCTVLATDTPSSSAWSTVVPTLTEERPFLWNFERVNYSDGTYMDTDPVIIGVYGKRGTSSYTFVRYSQYSDGRNMTDTPTSSTKYIGVCVKSENVVPVYTQFAWSKCIGENGTNGTSSYTFVRYSQYSDGTDFVILPTELTKYFGICIKNSSTAPTAKEEYTWSKYMGDNGANGTDGTSSYTHFRYANSASPSWSETSPSPTGKTYVGFAVTNTSTTPTDPAAYQWSKYVGADGIGVTKVAVEYANSNSTTTAPASGWSETKHAYDTNNGYYWTRTRTYRTNGTQECTEARYNAEVTTEALNAYRMGKLIDAGDGVSTIYYTDTIPGNVVENDIWYCTAASGTDKGKVYKIKSVNPVVKEDVTAYMRTTLSASYGAKSIADSKIVTFAQSDTPTPTDEGDLWIKTSENNKLYRANSSLTWVAVQDGSIATALSNASTAQTTANSAQTTANTANSKIDNLKVGGRNLLQGTADFGITVTKDSYSTLPKSANLDLQNPNQYQGKNLTWSFYRVCIGDANNVTSPYRFGGHAQVRYTDYDGTSHTVNYCTGYLASNVKSNGRVSQQFTVPTCTGKVEIIRFNYQASACPADNNNATWIIKDYKVEEGNTATDWTPAVEDTDSSIADAQATANTAQATANSKSRTYRSTTPPSNPSNGDIWIFSLNATEIQYRYDGTNWILIQDGTLGAVKAEATNTTAQASEVETIVSGTGTVSANAHNILINGGIDGNINHGIWCPRERIISCGCPSSTQVSGVENGLVKITSEMVSEASAAHGVGVKLTFTRLPNTADAETYSIETNWSHIPIIGYEMSEALKFGERYSMRVHALYTSPSAQGQAPAHEMWLHGYAGTLDVLYQGVASIGQRSYNFFSAYLVDRTKWEIGQELMASTEMSDATKNTKYIGIYIDNPLLIANFNVGSSFTITLYNAFLHNKSEYAYNTFTDSKAIAYTQETTKTKLTKENGFVVSGYEGTSGSVSQISTQAALTPKSVIISDRSTGNERASITENYVRIADADGATIVSMASGAKTSGNGVAAGGTKSITITVGNWTNKSYEYTMIGLSATATVIVSPAPASVSVCAAAKVRCSGQSAGKITFSCETVPTESVTMNVVLLGGLSAW